MKNVIMLWMTTQKRLQESYPLQNIIKIKTFHMFLYRWKSNASQMKIIENTLILQYSSMIHISMLMVYWLDVCASTSYGHQLSVDWITISVQSQTKLCSLFFAVTIWKKNCSHVVCYCTITLLWVRVWWLSCAWFVISSQVTWCTVCARVALYSLWMSVLVEWGCHCGDVVDLCLFMCVNVGILCYLVIFDSSDDQHYNPHCVQYLKCVFVFIHILQTRSQEFVY